ncbi:polysaccharide deacetylase [Neobittarella massiliensis]|uniref:polysaccharide deacetylase family protein n=1 Tax=Neobittarella massiliensis (ex Bilen et al. 2018) TaxID=2041842 RepID=UPI000CF6EBA4|nr:polysaccharide deacetylase [Neobittarella massiliensis]
MYTQHPKWPQNIQCAAMITVNLDAEYFWLQLDERAAHMPKTLSMGQYGMTRGLGRLLDILQSFSIKATFFVPGIVAEKYAGYMKDIVSAGHEIACHGYLHENLSLFDRAQQQERLKKAVAAIEKYSGVSPRGFRAPEGDLTLETLQIAHSLGMCYSSDLSDDDRPYFMPVDDAGTQMLQIPIQWANFDFPYLAFNYRPAFPTGQGRVAPYSSMLSNWKDEFTGHYTHHLCYVMQLDPQTIGNPGRSAILEEFLTFVKDKPGVWFATGSEMYDYCRQNESEILHR